MLKFLKINNIALIDELKVEFDAGLNVLSGETGAGKSIIIDSLSFVLGGKFDKSLIRTGQDYAQASAFFESVGEETKSILNELGLDVSDEILIFRKATKDKSEIKVNGVPATLSMLKQITQTLVDIHGQGENQKILSAKNQLEVIDKFCGENLDGLKNELEIEVENYSKIKKDIERIGGSASERERTLDFLKYQVKEIENAKLKLGEDEELSQIKTRMLSGEKISNGLSNALSQVSGAYNVSQLMLECARNLSGISHLDDGLKNIYERVKSCQIEIDDVVGEMQNLKRDLDFNQFEFDKVDARLDEIKALKKKYGASIEQVLEFLEKAKNQVEEIENGEILLSKLEKDLKNVALRMENIAGKISELRKKFAKKLETLVMEELESLAMKNAKFVVSFMPSAITKSGSDAIDFLFSANLGHEPKSLGKIISGGEMSRFCLALKNITFQSDATQTMIFDEVDTGISGKVAEVVAIKMTKIGSNKQVLAITHLPQIVAMADVSLFIEKTEDGSSTKTSVKRLDQDGHAQEVARLIGANMSSTHALEHAKELINFGKKFKKTL